MILETDRLLLRNFNKDDLDDLFEYAKIDEVGINAGWIPHTSKEHSMLVLNMFINDKNTFAIVYKENNKVIGSISLSRDKIRQDIKSKCLGYVLSKDYWAKGIMTEAVNKILEYSFCIINLDIVSISHFKDNIASKRVIEKNGFYYEGTFRNSFLLHNGQIKDRCFYSLTKMEYLNKKNRQ
ncbi:GNAT family protein [uncultured Tyzzerella sp.]|uniref:GNAT family N-acetyltransferase n=1 Tax=uncultured Tyzzerella sp. TaxID=2321398 RepID=UPI002941C48E|nr:GNAT family protein [uncultured Tyzzerella sp.]